MRRPQARRQHAQVVTGECQRCHLREFFNTVGKRAQRIVADVKTAVGRRAGGSGRQQWLAAATGRRAGPPPLPTYSNWKTYLFDISSYLMHVSMR